MNLVLRLLVRASLATITLLGLRWLLRGDLGTPEAYGGAALVCLAVAFIVGLAGGPWQGMLAGMIAALVSDFVIANGIGDAWRASWLLESMMWEYIYQRLVFTVLAGALGGLTGGLLTELLRHLGTLSLALHVALGWTAFVAAPAFVKWLLTIHDSTGYATSYALGQFQQGYWTQVQASALIDEAQARELQFVEAVVAFWLLGLLVDFGLTRLSALQLGAVYPFSAHQKT